jgi:hypothetical protein
MREPQAQNFFVIKSAHLWMITIYADVWKVRVEGPIVGLRSLICADIRSLSNFMEPSNG